MLAAQHVMNQACVRLPAVLSVIVVTHEAKFCLARARTAFAVSERTPMDWVLFLRVTNLFDERYYAAGRDNPFVFFESPQNPRWITAGVRASF